MLDLLVRGVDEALVRALKKRAGTHGRSAEAEHRAILAEVLTGPRKRRLAAVLAAIPNAGTDADFARIEPASKAACAFIMSRSSVSTRKRNSQTCSAGGSWSMDTPSHLLRRLFPAP